MKESEAIYVTKRLYKTEGKIHLEVEISEGISVKRRWTNGWRIVVKIKNNYIINYVNEYYVVDEKDLNTKSGDYSRFKVRAYNATESIENILNELKLDV